MRKYTEFADIKRCRREIVCVQLTFGYTHNIAAAVDFDFDMRRTFFIFDTPVDVVAEKPR
jgi:hypothetical protein